MREQILNKIRDLSKENGGQTPGVRFFENETGIRQSEWRGVYWARWSDAIREAGLEPNVKHERIEEEFFLKKLADSCRHYGRIPTAMEMRMYKRVDAEFPNAKSITRHFGSLRDIPVRLAEWVKAKTDYADLVTMFDTPLPPSEAQPHASTKEGFVYLIQSGAFYKLGRSDELERRVKEIRIALPDKAVLIHSIRTDDPSGIEAYWHRRFADRRANGEWFKLSASDLGAFKRRKYQ